LTLPAIASYLTFDLPPPPSPFAFAYIHPTIHNRTYASHPPRNKHLQDVFRSTDPQDLRSLLSYPSSTLATLQPPYRARVWKEVRFILAGTSEYNFHHERLYTAIRLVADPATSVRDGVEEGTRPKPQRNNVFEAGGYSDLSWIPSHADRDIGNRDLGGSARPLRQ
jgi:hypothetical protein